MRSVADVQERRERGRGDSLLERRGRSEVLGEADACHLVAPVEGPGAVARLWRERVVLELGQVQIERVGPGVRGDAESKAAGERVGATRMEVDEVIGKNLRREGGRDGVGVRTAPGDAPHSASVLDHAAELRAGA